MDIIETNSISKRTKAPPPPQALRKTEQDMPNMDTTNGHVARSRNGSSSSTNGTKPNTRCLRVHMPNGKIVQATVDANLSSSDLLVMMAGKNKLNPVSHTMKVPSNNPLEESITLKPSQCVGDINGDIVFLIAKAHKEQFSIKRDERKSAKFEKTIRLTVNYGTKHKMVLRINPDRTLADLLPQICDEKGVDPKHHTLRHPKTPSDELDLNKSLTSYETNELLLVDTRAPRQEASYMPEMVGDKKKKSFFGKLKKKKTGFDLDQTPSVQVTKSGGMSPTSPTRQRPTTVSGERAPVPKVNAEITRTQTQRKRAAPKPPSANKTSDEAAGASAKPVSRKKKAPAPPRPDEPPKSPTADEPPKLEETSSPEADASDIHLSMEESVEVEVHAKPNDEDVANTKRLNRRSSTRPLSPPPLPPGQDDQSICSSQNSDVEGDEPNIEQVVDEDVRSERHVECTCNQETGEHECILHRTQALEGAVGRVAESEPVHNDVEESVNKEEVNTLPSDPCNDPCDDLASVDKDTEDTGDDVDGKAPSKEEGLEIEENKNDDDKNEVEIKTEDEKEKSNDVYIETVQISDTKIDNLKEISDEKIELTKPVKEDTENIDKTEVSDMSKVTNGDVSKVTNDNPGIQKSSATEVEVKDLKDKYEVLQQQFATLQQQMINSQQNMLEQHKVQSGAPVMSAQDMLALQTQQMQQLIQQQMLLQSQGMMNAQQTTPVTMQPGEPKITAQKDTKAQTPQDLHIPKKSPPHPEIPKKVQSPEADKDLASAFRSLKPKSKPTKHSYIFSAAMRPRAESDAAKSSNMAGYEAKRRSGSNPDPQSVKTTETVKPSVKPLQSKVEVINENNSEKFSPKEAIVHPNVVIIDKTPDKIPDNPKTENGVLSGRSSSIPQATVAPQPASKPVAGRTGTIIAYQNPRTEELQDIQTSGSVSKFRQMFAGNST